MEQIRRCCCCDIHFTACPFLDILFEPFQQWNPGVIDLELTINIDLVSTQLCLYPYIFLSKLWLICRAITRPCNVPSLFKSVT